MSESGFSSDARNNLFTTNSAPEPTFSYDPADFPLRQLGGQDSVNGPR